MTLALTVEKGSKLVKLSKEVRDMSTRVNRAFERYNARVTRAQAELKDELQAAVIGAEANVGPVDAPEPVSA
jgi:hypothetical protein